MKKKLILIISSVLICSIILWIINAFSKVEPVNDEWSLTMGINKVSNVGGTVFFSQEGGNLSNDLETGSYYFLEILDDDKWVPLKYKDELKDENIGWNSMAYIIKRSETTEFKVTWEWLYGKLKTGKYRIGKDVTYNKQKKTYYAEFVIE